MNAKLGLYLVRSFTNNPTARTRLSLVIAETAEQAADRVAFRDGEPFERICSVEEDGVNGVGRLGDYEPGITGHNMVMQRPSLVLTETWE